MIRRLGLALLFLASSVASVVGAGACGAPPGTDGAPSATEAAPIECATVSPARPCAPHAPKHLAPAAERGASSAVTIARLGDAEIVLVADEDERALHVFDARSMTQAAVVPMDGAPAHVAVLDDGLVAVTLRDAGKVVLLEPGAAPADAFEVRCAIDVAAEPIAMTEAEGRLLVTSGAGAALSIVDTAAATVERAIALPREPRAVLYDAGTKTTFVSHAVGGIVSAVDLAGAKAPDRIDLRAGHRMKSLVEEDERPREASQGFALASVDMGGGHTRILAPHASVDPGASRDPDGGGYGGAFEHRAVAPIVSVVDPVARRSLTRSVAGGLAGRLVQDCLLPRSAVARAGRLWVACVDLDAVLELDATISDPSQVELRRIEVPSPGDVALSDDGTRLFAWSQFTRSLARVDVAGASLARVVAVPWRRSGVSRSARVERGRALFHASHDARIGPARACATCHPDGRDDSLVWTSPDGPRQTPTLAGRLEGTAPYGWFGENA
ncbi:MAG TPA: hypothetical protein VL400_10435, partial [Polyangiaceae bacterium]|nr:hypothetical protein [Polyangiaceae bacterium]